MDRNQITDLLEEAESGLRIFVRTKHYGVLKVGNPKRFLQEQQTAGKTELLGHIEIGSKGAAILTLID